jgi:hypothetical protein
MDGNIARQGEDKCSQISVFKPEGKRPFGRTVRRCEDNIKVGRFVLDSSD